LLYPVIDYNGGLRYSFINAMSYDILSSWLKNDNCISAVIHNDSIISIYIKREEEKKNRVIVDTCSSHPTVSEYIWNPYIGELPENMVHDLRSRTKNKHVEGVIRFALGTNTCVGKLGVAIPQTLLGKTLDIPQRTAGRAIGCAVKLGILRKTIPAIESKRAAKYVLCGFWAVWARNMFKASPTGSQVGLKAIVDQVCDGNWNDPLFKMTNFFPAESDFLAFVSGLPDFHEKPERKSQAVSAWKSHVERDASRTVPLLKEA